MQVHVQTFILIDIDNTGTPLKKSSATLKNYISKSMEKQHRVNLPGSSYPTLETYLASEAVAGFKLQHLDQTYIVTYKDP